MTEAMADPASRTPTAMGCATHPRAAKIGRSRRAARRVTHGPNVRGLGFGIALLVLPLAACPDERPPAASCTATATYTDWLSDCIGRPRPDDELGADVRAQEACERAADALFCRGD